MTNIQAINLLKGLWQSLDDYCELNDEGKAAFCMAIEALSCSEFPNSSDCISRQAAIDIERNATVDTNPSHFEAHQKFTQFMDDAEISSFGRWQWSNGFNTALIVVDIDLKNLPSADRPSGHWIDIDTQTYTWKVRCNKCGHERSMMSTQGVYPNFCEHCGADMRGE